MNYRFSVSAALLLSFVFVAEISYSQDFRIEQSVNAGPASAFVSLRYSAKDFGVAMIDNKGILKWEVPIPGLILGIGKRNADLLVFYTKEFNKYGTAPEIKEIHGALVSSKQKRILSDVVVYTKEDKFMIVPSIENDPTGNFSCLLVRTSAAKKGGFFDYSSISLDKQSATTSLTAVFLDDALAAKNKELASAALGGTLLNSCANARKELYVVSFSGAQLVAEKFDGEGKQIDKESSPVSLREKSLVRGVCSYDSLSGDAIDELVQYENEDKKNFVRLFHFDFSSKKALAVPEKILDKDYAKEINNGERSSHLKGIESLKPVQVFETVNNLITIREIQYVYSMAQRDAATRFTRDDAIISIYSRDLQLLHEIVIDKSIESFIRIGNGVGGYLKDGKLFVIACEGDGIAAYKEVLYTIDIPEGTQKSRTLNRAGAGRGLLVEPDSVLWFQNSFVTPLEFGKAFFTVKFTTTLQLQKYE